MNETLVRVIGFAQIFTSFNSGTSTTISISATAGPTIERHADISN